MTILKHLSYDIDTDIDVFTPRIPLQRMYGENNTVARVCVAPSVDDCLYGSPYTAELFPRDGYIERGEVAIVCHTDAVGDDYHGVPFVIYTFDVSDDDVMTPAALTELVPDATYTDEHWLIASATPIKREVYLLHDAIFAEGDWRYFYMKLDPSDVARFTPVDAGDYILGL